jgi:hypothetical protein
LNYQLECFKQEIDEFILENGQTFVLRHRNFDGSVTDHKIRAVKSTTNPDRSLSDSIRYYSPGTGNEEYVRFIFDINTIDFFPIGNDVVFEPLCKEGYLYVPIKLLNVYRVSHVDTINFDDRLLFLTLYANREELGKWTTIQDR